MGYQPVPEAPGLFCAGTILKRPSLSDTGPRPAVIRHSFANAEAIDADKGRDGCSAIALEKGEKRWNVQMNKQTDKWTAG